MSDFFFIREIAYIGVLQGAPRNPLDTMRASQTMEELWGGFAFGSMSMCSFCGDWMERAANNFHFAMNNPPEDMIAQPHQHLHNRGVARACCGFACPSYMRYFCDECDVHHLPDEHPGMDTCAGAVCDRYYTEFHSYCGCSDEYDDDEPDIDIAYHGESVIRCRTCNTPTTNFDYVREIWCCSCRIPMPNPIKETV